MKLSFLLPLALSCFTAAKEIKPNAAISSLYDSGSVHKRLVEMKLREHAENRALGVYNSANYPAINSLTPCVNGYAGEFKCKNTSLRAFLSHADMGSRQGEGSSMWGWTSDDGREIAVVGQMDGAAFVEVLKDGGLKYLGRLPQTTGARASEWREIRVYKSYAIIGSESDNHGVQIFDLRKLLTLTSPKTFDAVRDLTGHFKQLPIGRTHNIVINEAKQYAIAVGANPRTDKCKSGLIFIDLKDPSKPTTPGCAAQDGYVHDAQCLPYKGPDTRYTGRDICYAFNEDTLTIYDVTNPASSTVISRTSYTGAAYTHQGWLLDPNWQTRLIVDDELDEVERKGPAADGFPVTYFWDISNLRSPKQTGYFKSSVKSIDHNQYIVGNYTYQSNYGAGLRVLDLTTLHADATGKNVKEVAYFDCHPEDDRQSGGGSVSFVGTWASYPFFKSGWILINTIERGLFSVRLDDAIAGPGRAK